MQTLESTIPSSSVEVIPLTVRCVPRRCCDIRSCRDGIQIVIDKRAKVVRY